MSDYYSRRMGFVIDDVSFPTKESAFFYLVDECCMDDSEAESFLDRIRREYMARLRTATAKGGAF